MKRIEEHYQEIIKYGIPEEQILGVFLYGSQNYNFDLPNSDIDTKAIIIPTIEEAILNKPIIKELHLANGEHCEIMDIRHFVDNLKKQNINFVEILYTDFKILNPKYKKIWNEYFISIREKIAHYDKNKTLMSIIGQIRHTIYQNPNDGKKIANCYRLIHFLNRYFGGEPYQECITLNEPIRSYLLKLKQEKNIQDSKHFEIINQTCDIILKNYSYQYPKDTIIENIIKEGTLKLII